MGSFINPVKSLFDSHIPISLAPKSAALLYLEINPYHSNWLLGRLTISDQGAGGTGGAAQAVGLLVEAVSQIVE